MSAVVILFVLMLGAYSWWILRRVISWKLYPTTPSAQAIGFKPRVSVVVAARNEAIRIDELLDDLLIQDYPAELMEIVIADDFSDDDTVELVEKKLSFGKFEYRVIKSAAQDAQGKKHALWRAINAAKGDIILATDADCRLSTHWVSSMVVKFHDPEINMVAGMVAIGNAEGMLSKFECMDQMVLSAVGAACLANGTPLLCSGANLAFRKSAFEKVGGYSYGINDPSGDDTYLMFQLGASVAYNKDKESLVLTEPVGSFLGLIHQRIRWASKMKGYGKPYITFTGAVVSLVNLAPLFLVVLYVLDFLPVWFLFVWFLLKFTMDMLLVKPIASFYGQSSVLTIAPLYALIYPFYTLVAFFTLFKKGYEWKGRRHGY